MTENYSQFWDYHIDSLGWLNYPFDWRKYLQKILPPQNKSPNYIGKYLCSNLISSSSFTHRLEEWYINRLVKSLDDLCEKLDWKHIIIATPEINHFFDEPLKTTNRTTILNGDIPTVCDIIMNCSGFVGIDSAWRLLGYAKGVPTLSISKDCQNYSQVPISHQLRWLCWPKTTFGRHHPTNEIINLLEKMIENKIYMEFPELAFANNISNVIICRDYKVNLEKSILNS